MTEVEYQSTVFFNIEDNKHHNDLTTILYLLV